MQEVVLGDVKMKNPIEELKEKIRDKHNEIMGDKSYQALRSPKLWCFVRDELDTFAKENYVFQKNRKIEAMSLAEKDDYFCKRILEELNYIIIPRKELEDELRNLFYSGGIKWSYQCPPERYGAMIALIHLLGFSWEKAKQFTLKADTYGELKRFLNRGKK